MPTLTSRKFFVLAAVACCATPGLLLAQVRPRLPKIVDNGATVRLAGSTHPLALAEHYVGRASADLPMERMTLLLRSTPEQQAALEQLIAEQHDPSSDRYAQWLTPEQFGERFGVAEADLAAITAWLEDQGFQVDGIPAGRRSIDFSGTARQVERAFSTEIAHYRVNGESHVANATDISIPEALASVVEAVVSLHDFSSQPMHHVIPAPELASPVAPRFNLSGGGHALSPYDFAAIYNVSGLWNLKFDGTGQVIAIAGRTNIKQSDVTGFRTTFGLTGGSFQVILNGKDPGILSSGEEMEADLDLEWAGAVAKGATVQLVVSPSTATSDGVTASAAYIVNKNQASVMSVSFGACETAMGSANQYFNSLWQQAASQGISVFVSSGDSGSAGCDSPSGTKPASGGLSVNGLGSSPYNVAVGGTQFADTAQPSAYWNSSMDSHSASAKGYIPEAVWNESSYTKAGASTNNLYAGGGGASTVWATPSWQTGTGVPASDPFASGQHHRYVPDVSLTAAGHDGYIVESEGKLWLVGGTSASSPAMAGIMAILNQYTGTRTGNPNPKFYALASKSAFHDTLTGTNAVPCAAGSPGCSAAAGSAAPGVMKGYNAGTGYDLATGLGSVDAYTLALVWGNKTAVPPAITSLSPNPMTGSATAQTLTINGTGFQTGATVSASYSGGASVALAVSTLNTTQIVASITTGTTARTWSIQVTNPGNSASNVASLTVNAPPTGPSIASLSPSPMTGSAAAQTLTITGTGFQTGATVTASYTGSATSNLQVISVTSTTVKAYITTGTTARTWSIQVINPGSVKSNTASLQVTAPAPAPVIQSVSPASLVGSTSFQTVTINGSNFGSGLTLYVSATTSATFSVMLTSLTATQLKLQLAPGTAARSFNFRVVNPDGQSSGTASLTVTAGK